jgi:hypothetical protein
MLIVPTLVPVVGAVATEGTAEAAEPAGDVAGVVALLVWANAEIAKKTAVTRENRKNLFVIGLLELLGTWFRE